MASIRPSAKGTIRVPLAAMPGGASVERELGRLGSVAIARVSCAEGSHQLDLGRSTHAEPGHAFLLQVRGEGRFTQYGRTAELREGDLTLCDAAAPHSYVAGDGAELLVVSAPAGVIADHLPSPEPFCARRLCAGDGLSDSAIELTRCICDQLETGILAEAHNRVARNLLDLLATAFAIAFDDLVGASPVMSGRHARVKLHIEQRLKDPDLSPGSIAESLKLSPRYLRMIFRLSGVTVTAYVLRRRLEECARELADPRLRSMSITEIAFSWGFNSAPHFSRSFGERFGLSPRAYRQSAMRVEVPEGSPPSVSVC